MRTDELVEHFRRHGIPRTLLAYALTGLGRFIDFQIVRVERIETGPPLPLAEEAAYVTREVTPAEYTRGVRDLPGAEGEHERPWAFARGDRCFANLIGEDIVGYTFYATEPTPVRAGLAFRFPDGAIYLYASFTHPEHRGRRLPVARANARRRADTGRHGSGLVLWYVAIENLASRAGAARAGAAALGYAGFLHTGRRFLCFASRQCRRLEVGFTRSEERMAAPAPYEQRKADRSGGGAAG